MKNKFMKLPVVDIFIRLVGFVGFVGFVGLVLGVFPPAVSGEMPPASEPGKAQKPEVKAAEKEKTGLPAQPEEKKCLLPEGYRIADLSAKLVNSPQDNRWFLVFDSSLGQEESPKQEEKEQFRQPIEILPGQKLTEMKEVCRNSTDLTITFRVWGEITAYRKRNFILPTHVYQKTMFGDIQKEETNRNRPANTLEARLSPTPDPQDSSESETTIPAEAPIPADLRAALQAIPRTHSLSAPTEKEPEQPAESPKEEGFAIGGYSPAIWRDGYMVVDRVGRIVFDPELQCWLFAFETDANSMAEPPVIIHPSRLLEVMENVVERSGRSSLFRVTGQVTKYQGKNYLLLRKMLLVYDMGNLGK